MLEFHMFLKRTHYCHFFKEIFCEVRKKNHKHRCPPIYMHTKELSHMHIQRQIHAHESTKLNPNHGSYLSYQSAIPSKVPHDCPKPYIPLSCCTWWFQTHPWAEQSTYAPGFFSTLPYQCGNTVTAVQRKMPGLATNPKRLSWKIIISKLRTVWFL